MQRERFSRILRILTYDPSEKRRPVPEAPKPETDYVRELKLEIARREANGTLIEDMRVKRVGKRTIVKSRALLEKLREEDARDAG